MMKMEIVNAGGRVYKLYTHTANGKVLMGRFTSIAAAQRAYVAYQRRAQS